MEWRVPVPCGERRRGRGGKGEGGVEKKAKTEVEKKAGERKEGGVRRSGKWTRRVVVR